MEFVEQWSGLLLPLGLSGIGWLAPNLVLDTVQRTDALQRLGIQGIRPCGMQVVELAPRMRPARSFDDIAALANLLVAAIGIGLKRAFELGQVLLRMLALAVRGVGEPDCGRRGVARVPVIAHIDPQPSRLCLAVAGSEHRHRGIVGMQFRGRHHVSAQCLDQRLQQVRTVAHPFRQQRAIQSHAFACIDHGLTI
ncbi:hypothetical protein PHO31112_05319 [Pandoraea horticolens]|uniref:Uncharacterized protein n=1 Tax=Pandoraea horticolens TaxID=2508298 RepID=A0A5E4ZCP2_9BURK|nr:hypothetical protein PHO31112_05319 [Pandoraea horticolens]